MNIDMNAEVRELYKEECASKYDNPQNALRVRLISVDSDVVRFLLLEKLEILDGKRTYKYENVEKTVPKAIRMTINLFDSCKLQHPYKDKMTEASFS